jgi:redox-sensitive bicupin YhaK (pirin superfamily)
MITIRRSADRGYFDHGWLQTYHTFSFADYRDPEHRGLSKLRVINQDRVQPGQGFSTHGHENMEILSVVLDGVLEHKDSMGNGSQIRAGDVQFMSAGSGVTHSEFNASQTEPVHFLQMWVLPAERGTRPRYAQKHFSAGQCSGGLCLFASPDGREGSIRIGQDVNLYGSLLRPGETIEERWPSGRPGWLHVSRGALCLNDHVLEEGDGAALQDEEHLRILGRKETEFVLFDLP